MITDPEALRSRILFALEGMETDPTDLARQIGRGADYIRDFIRGRKKSIKLEDLAKIERALSLSEGYLTNEEQWKGTPAETLLKRSLPRMLDTMYENPEVRRSSKGVEIYAPELQAKTISIVIADPVEVVARPWFLKEAKNVYGLLVPDSSMAPAYEPGDVIIINQHLPYMIGKDFVVRTETLDGSFRMTMGRLTGWTLDAWHLIKLSDGEAFDVSRADWPRIDRIVGRMSG